jgi:predicted RNA-binding Zn ribbon-like protein
MISRRKEPLLNADVVSALQAGVDLVNTHPKTRADHADALDDSGELASYLQAHGEAGMDATMAQVRAWRRIRSDLYSLWELDRSGAAEALNRLLEGLGARLELVPSDGGYRLRATSVSRDTSKQLAANVAMAFVELVQLDEFDRLGVCESTTCNQVFVDFSRNRSKRYCDLGTCGNRENVRAHRARYDPNNILTTSGKVIPRLMP